MSRSSAAAHWSAVLLSTVSLVALGCGGAPSSDGTAASPDESSGEVVELGSNEVEVTLYFPGDGWYLLAEPRAMTRWDEPLAGARAILSAVLEGPRSEALVAPLPEDVGLGETSLTERGLLYVDLVSTEHERPPVDGSLAELLAVYSLVDSVLLNVPQIDAVVLLWNGRQPTTFAGHVDTSLPLSADEDLLATRR